MLARTTGHHLGCAALAFVLFANVAPAEAGPRTADEIRRAHRQVLESLNHGGKGGGPRSLDEPAASRLLAQGWSLVGEWASSFLDAHPDATPEALAESLSELNPPAADAGGATELVISGSALKLGAETYLLEADDGVTGTFFVLGKTPSGTFRTLWNVKDLAAAHLESRDEIGRWAYVTDPSYGDGPLVGSIHPLPPTGAGHPRFFVNAWSVGDGGTRLRQLSVWEWDGNDAKSLLIKTYDASVETSAATFDGTLLVVPTKEWARTFAGCGSCPEPEGRWTIRVTAAGVEDLGRVWKVPELQLIDELVDRISRRGDVSTLASPRVVRSLQRALAESKTDDGQYWLGLLDDARISRKDGRVTLAVTFDEGSFVFTLEQRKSGPYVAAAKVR